MTSGPKFLSHKIWADIEETRQGEWHVRVWSSLPVEGRRGNEVLPPYFLDGWKYDYRWQARRNAKRLIRKWSRELHKETI